MSFACPTTNRRKPAEIPPHVLDFVADVVDVVMRPVAENEPSLLSKLFADPGIALDVRPVFAFHQSVLLFGQVPWSGHPCQKQPSRNTETLALVRAMSGRPGAGP